MCVNVPGNKRSRYKPPVLALTTRAPGMQVGLSLGKPSRSRPFALQKKKKKNHFIEGFAARFFKIRALLVYVSGLQVIKYLTEGL